MKQFFNNEEMKLEDLGNGVSRKILAHNGNLMSVEVNFEKGALGNLHTHVHEQVTYVLEGEFEFTVGEERKIVKKGDTIYMEKDILHGCKCLEAGRLLDIFTPVRADFLNK